MGRLRHKYDKKLVNEALDELYSACDAIENTNTDIEKGIKTILNARGSENIKIDFTIITNYQSQVIDYIENIGTDIKRKQEEIEEYDSASGWKKFWNTFAMGGLKLIEGIAVVGEQLTDGVVSITGFLVGIFSSKFKDSCAEFVKKDHVGDSFYNAYETGWLQDVNKYSVMSHQSTAANILKGVGTATGYIVIGAATGGIGAAGAATSLGISATAAAVGGIGSGTQRGLQAGQSFDQAFGQGVKQGAVAAGTTLVLGGLANKLAASGRLTPAFDSIDDLSSATSSAKGAINTVQSALANGGDEMAAVAKDLGKMSQQLDDVLAFADDAMLNGGKTSLTHAKEAFKSAKELSNTAKTLTESAKMAGLSDDIITQLDDVSKSVSSVATNAKLAQKAVAGTQTFAETGKIGQTLGKAGDKMFETVGKIGSKLPNGIQTAANGAISVTSKALGNISHVATNAIATGAGAVVAGNTNTPTNYNNYLNQNDIANDNSDNINTDTDTSKIPPTATETFQHETTPEPDNSIDTIATQKKPTGVQNNQYYPYSNGESESSTSIKGEEVKLPEDSTSTSTNINNENGVPGSTNTNYESGNSSSTNNNPENVINRTDDIVGSVNLGNSTNPSSHSALTTPENIIESTDTEMSDEMSETLLDAAGDISGSLSNIASSSPINIPTSSTPITSTNTRGSSGSSVIPLAAGLGAASIAGIGTKAYLDRKENKEENNESSIDMEEWEEDIDSVNIEYDEDMESDYLSPVDEYAYQEEPQESYQAVNSSELASMQ